MKVRRALINFLLLLQRQLISIRMCSHMHAHTRTHTYTHAHTRTYTHAHMHTHKHVHTCIPCIHTNAPTYTHSFIHACTDTQNTHTYTFANPHTVLEWTHWVCLTSKVWLKMQPNCNVCAVLIVTGTLFSIVQVCMGGSTINSLKFENLISQTFHHLALKRCKISNSWEALNFVRTSNFRQRNTGVLRNRGAR